MTTYNCHTSTDITNAIAACALGDTLVLDAGVTFNAPSGGFIFTDKGAGSSWITVTTSNTSLLPSKLAAYPTNWSPTNSNPSQYRIQSSEAANMPKLVSVDDSNPAIVFNLSAHHWKFIGLEVTNVTSTGLYLQGGLIGTSSSPITSISDFAHDLWFESCYIHPQEETGDVSVNYLYRSVEKGAIINGTNITFTHCAFQGITGRDPGNHAHRLDTNAILYGVGQGGFTVDHCLLEGQANNIWGGGGSGQLTIPAHTATMSSPAVTSGTLSSLTDLAVGELFSVYIDKLHARQLTTNDDPDGLSPGPVISGYGVGKVLSISGSNITFDNLQSGYTYNNLRVKFGTGVTGGTFTLTWAGQTTSAISFPSQAVTGASNATPIRITCVAHGANTNDKVRIAGVGGNTAANGNWTITKIDADHFDLTDDGFGDGPAAGNGNYTSGGTIANRAILASNISTALAALSSPPTITSVDPNAIYVTQPTYGVQINFGGGIQATPATPTTTNTNTLSVDGTNLTGSGTVSTRVEANWKESHSAVASFDAPNSGAAVAWAGVLADGFTIKNNIIPKQALWYADLGPQKGFAETKAATNILWEGNIFTGAPTGIIFEVNNQGGSSPWSTITDLTIRNNLWDQTGEAVAIAMNQQDRTERPSNWTVSNNLFLSPAFGNSYPWGGNGATTIINVTISHNTIFMPYDLINGIAGADYDYTETPGFSQLSGWIVKDNILQQRASFFRAICSGSTCGNTAPYNYSDMRTVYPDMVADHNAVIDDTLSGSDPGSFFALHAGNWQIEDTVASVGFMNAPAALDMTGNYRLQRSSIYAAGNARQASDGTDVGVDMDALIAALGFDPFVESVPSASVKLIAICI